MSLSQLTADEKTMQSVDLHSGRNLITPQKIHRAAFLILRPCVRIAPGAFQNQPVRRFTSNHYLESLSLLLSTSAYRGKMHRWAPVASEVSPRGGSLENPDSVPCDALLARCLACRAVHETTGRGKFLWPKVVRNSAGLAKNSCN